MIKPSDFKTDLEFEEALLSTYQAMPQEKIDYELVCACAQGDYEVAVFLLTNQKLERRANPCYDKGACVLNAHYYGHMQIVRFLLSSELIENPNVNDNDGYLFLEALRLVDGYTIAMYIDSPDIKHKLDLSCKPVRDAIDEFIQKYSNDEDPTYRDTAQYLSIKVEKLDLESGVVIPTTAMAHSKI